MIPDEAMALWDYNLSISKTSIVDTNNNGSYGGSDSTTEFYPGQNIQYNLNYNEVGTWWSWIIISDILPDGVCFRLWTITATPGQIVTYYSDTSFTQPYTPNGSAGTYDCAIKSFKITKNPTCVSTKLFLHDTFFSQT